MKIPVMSAHYEVSQSLPESARPTMVRNQLAQMFATEMAKRPDLIKKTRSSRMDWIDCYTCELVILSPDDLEELIGHIEHCLKTGEPVTF